jgi:hypothetical protein
MRLLDSVQVLSGFAAAWTSLAPAERLAPLPLRQLNLNGKGLRFAAFQNISTLNAHQAAATLRHLECSTSCRTAQVCKCCTPRRHLRYHQQWALR